jgi:spermidine dehydrogenase
VSDITRRDFLNGMVLLGAGGLTGSLSLPAAAAIALRYPPGTTGFRGCQPGAAAAAHRVATTGALDFGPPSQPAEQCDLVVIGAGISGLSAAYFYREQIRNDARILILDIHDDFGGHAARNEFEVDGQRYLSYGGDQSIDTPSGYSKVALGLLRSLGVDLGRFETAYDRDFFKRHGLTQGVFYDAETFGQPVLLPSGWPDQRDVTYYTRQYLPGMLPPPVFADRLAAAPLTDAQRIKLREVLSVPQRARAYFKGPRGESRFRGTNYVRFLRDVYGIEDRALVALLSLVLGEDSALGGNMVSMESAAVGRLLGVPPVSFFRRWMDPEEQEPEDPYIHHFPDGCATVARLLVQKLVPDVARFQSVEEALTSAFDYGSLDLPDRPVRIRLGSAVVHAGNGHGGVVVRYVRDNRLHEVRARHAVMAGWHIMAAHIIPELPERQRAAMSANLKLPIVYAQVALRQWSPVRKGGVAAAYCPGSYFQFVQMDFPVSLGAYKPRREPDAPMVMLMIRMPCASFGGEKMTDFVSEGCGELMHASFADYETQIRGQLRGMFGAHGFDADRDIAAITVNRWPHGYVWDEALYDGKPAGEQARLRHGNIVFANSDSAGSAYMDDAIDMAWRAVREIGGR